MSRIFSFEQVRRGAIPDAAAFRATLEEMRHVFEREPAIKGALLFGSALPARGDAGPASDVDCLVAYDWRWRDHAFTAMMELTLHAKKKYVPLQLIPFDDEMAAHGFHTIGEDLKGHLAWAAAQGGVIKNNPLRFLDAPAVEGLVEGYITHKLSALQKGYVRYSSMSEEEQFRFLGKVLDMPVYLARKMLWQFGHHLVVDSKAQVADEYVKHVPREMADIFRAMLAAKQAYTDAISAPDARKLSLFQYRMLINSVEGAIEQAIAFLRLNVFLLEQRVRKHKVA